MRLARLTDYKRRIRTKAAEWPLVLNRFAFTDVPSLGTAETPLTSPFIILSGPNGVGKSTVLRAIWAAADPGSARLSPMMALKLTTGSATIDYSWHDENMRSEVNFAGGKVTGGLAFPTSVIHLDASSEPLQYQREFCEFETAEDIINGVGGNKLDEKTIAEMNYICRRSYRSITVYEVEDGEALRPFFEVQHDGDTYDSRTMGAGEVSALHTWWTVNRAAENSLLLIEEPETFLSPASQKGMAHFLLASTFDKKLVTILTSHSAKIVDSVAGEHRVFLYRDGTGAKFAEVPVSPILLASIGIEATVGTLMLVEDEAAALFLTQLLEHLDPIFARTCEISDQHGDGNIVLGLNRIAGHFQHVRVIGVFDGDLRNKVPKESMPFAAYLPGAVPIETTFRELLTAQTADAAEILSKPKLGEVLFGLQGADHHDWYGGLCEGLSLTKAQLFPMLFALWIKQPGNDELANQTLESIRVAMAGKGQNGEMK